jgi:hypothetical protein
MVFTGLASKPVATVFSSLASKLVVTVSPGLAAKPAVGSLVEPQNQGGGGFPDLGLKTGSSGLVIWTSKSPRWFLGLGLMSYPGSKKHRTEASIRVPRMFKSHAWQQYDKQMKCYE